MIPDWATTRILLALIGLIWWALEYQATVRWVRRRLAARYAKQQMREINAQPHDFSNGMYTAPNPLVGLNTLPGQKLREIEAAERRRLLLVVGNSSRSIH